MARVLALDDDALARAVIVDLVRGLGHEVVAAPGGAEALDLLDQRAYDLVIADILMPGIDGFELAERIAGRDKPPPVILTSGFFRGDAEAHARSRGIPVRGFLPKPLEAATLKAVVEAVLPARAAGRKPVAGAGADTWSGLSFLAGVRGPFERVPPMRVLFLAHRVDATGAVMLDREEFTGRVVVRGGRVMHVEGLPGLLGELDRALPDTRDLGRDVGAAVAAGHPVDRVIEAAALGLGEFLARLVGQRGGMVSFDPDAAGPPGAFPLPVPIPRLVSAGLRQGRPLAQVDRAWSRLSQASVKVRVPDDSPETRWGLDATTMRVLRVAQTCLDVGHLLREAGATDSTRRGEVLRALDLLYLLGLLTVDGGPLEQESTPSPACTPPPAARTVEDPRIGRLRSALSAMEGASALDVLEIGDRKTLAEDDLVYAYRDISKRFHPDSFFSGPPLVRQLAEACFARVNEAYEALRMPGAIAEARRVLAARAAGKPYVSDRDHQAARVAFKRGEVLYRNRDWRGADALFVEAVRLDPDAWPHALDAARAGYLCRRLSLDQALAALDMIVPPDAAKRAQVAVSAGNMLKLESRHDDALKRYRAALEADPENHDAQREIRLHSQRQEREKASDSGVRSSTGVISDLFRRSTDKK
ncbi:MAG: response regulator [Deltaproteobacteria bacterium]|nr:response regulator [Deltaproteobacteria bacterium]